MEEREIRKNLIVNRIPAPIGIVTGGGKEVFINENTIEQLRAEETAKQQPKINQTETIMLGVGQALAQGMLEVQEQLKTLIKVNNDLMERYRSMVNKFQSAMELFSEDMKQLYNQNKEQAAGIVNLSEVLEEIKAKPIVVNAQPVIRQQGITRPLTAQQQKVWELMKQGKTQQQIAEEMGCTPQNIGTIVQKIHARGF